MRFVLLFAISIFSINSYSKCWVVTNLHGYTSMSGDDYNYVEDGITGGVFKITIDKASKTASVFDTRSGYVGDMDYRPVSENTLVGRYESGGGITIETWSITTDKKALYSKVMNLPGFQTLTSTKALVGDVVGTCDPDQQ